MLAQSFKTAQDLNLTDEQHSALIKVLVLLETEEISHVDYSVRDNVIKGHHFFNMSTWLHNYENEGCGTVGCIAGTACHIAKNDKLFRRTLLEPGGVEQHTPLARLFYPNVSYGTYRDITTEHAATALRSYLTTGDMNWPAITGLKAQKRNW